MCPGLIYGNDITFNDIKLVLKQDADYIENAWGGWECERRNEHE